MSCRFLEPVRQRIPAPRRGFSGCCLGVALVVAGVVASGCVSYGGSNLSAKVQSWVTSSSFVSDHDTLIDDVARAHAAVSQGTALQLRTVCSGFEADVGTAYDTLPSPSATLTSTLNAADQDFFKAAGDCANVSSTHAAVVTSAFGEMSAGIGQLDKAAKELATFGVHWAPHR